jgi:hypothetical protein
MKYTSTPLHPYTVGFTLSAALSSIVNTALVIIKEENPEILAYMKSLTTHHWITHGLFIVAFFFLAGFVISEVEDTHLISGRTLSVILVVSVIGSSLALLGFFLFE